MAESSVSQVTVHTYFRPHGIAAGNVIHDARHADGNHINEDEPGQGIQRGAADEVVQGIALKLGNQQVHPCGHEAAKNHYQQRFAVFFHIGQHFAHAKEGQRPLFVYRSHASTSSADRD